MCKQANLMATSHKQLRYPHTDRLRNSERKFYGNERKLYQTKPHWTKECRRHMNTALLHSLKASESVEALLSGQTEIDFRKENRAGISTGQRLQHFYTSCP